MSGEDGSTNNIDQLLGSITEPQRPVRRRDLTRARSSAYIVHGNFRELAGLCENISDSGLIVADATTPATDVENEVYRRVHNYISSLYSYNEQIRNALDNCLAVSIGKEIFLPTVAGKSTPLYVQRGAFVWGLRNDFQHGDYWCLSVTQEQSSTDTTRYHLRFNKRDFEPTPSGNVDSAGRYLAHAPDSTYEYPLPYFASFHRELFAEFEAAFESWCERYQN